LADFFDATFFAAFFLAGFFAAAFFFARFIKISSGEQAGGSARLARFRG
jgi:hypothetical protein